MSEKESKINDDLGRLLQKQKSDISGTGDQIEAWTKFKKDYEQLKNLINTMNDKIKHPYNIPIAGSKLAYLPGHIIHTNELLVLLGDNYFTLRSSKQATDMIDRRLAHVNEELKKHTDAKRNLEEWLKISEDHKREKEEFVEIIERG